MHMISNLNGLLSRLLEDWGQPGDGLTLTLLASRFGKPPFKLTYEKHETAPFGWEIKLFYRSREIGRGSGQTYSIALVRAAIQADGAGFRLGSYGNMEGEGLVVQV